MDKNLFSILTMLPYLTTQLRGIPCRFWEEIEMPATTVIIQQVSEVLTDEIG